MRLGLGLGADPLDAKQLRFVYEDHLLALPTMAVVLAPLGFWMKDPAVGVDWEEAAARRTGFHAAQACACARRSHRSHAHRRDSRQGQGQGCARLHRAHDFRCCDRRGDRHFDIDQLFARRWRLRRPERADAGAAQASGACARQGLRSRDAAAAGADLPAQRRLQSAACRPRGRHPRRLQGSHIAWPLLARRRRPRDPEDRLRLRSRAARFAETALFVAPSIPAKPSARKCGSTARTCRSARASWSATSSCSTTASRHCADQSGRK